jgi:hypothetical protein
MTAADEIGALGCVACTARGSACARWQRDLPCLARYSQQTSGEIALSRAAARRSATLPAPVEPFRANSRTRARSLGPVKGSATVARAGSIGLPQNGVHERPALADTLLLGTASRMRRNSARSSRLVVRLRLARAVRLGAEAAGRMPTERALKEGLGLQTGSRGG